MPKRILLLTAISAFLFFTANAQTDSTHYDLGHVLVKKDFTQAITIKGSDLERYPFANLADAINVWLYGAYSNSTTLVYVVDGNMVTDVNAYDIHDIEEVTLVQNALSQLNGAGPPQQLVLIKTRRNKPGKKGIEASGQTSLVSRRNTAVPADGKSDVNLFHQYYLSAYQNNADSHFGASASFMRDVIPFITGDNYKVNDPYHYTRYKFNAYAGIKPWKGSTLDVGVNWVPEEIKADESNVLINAQPTLLQSHSFINVEHLVSADLSLKSDLGSGLKNTLSAGYSHFNYHGSDEYDAIYLTDPANRVSSLSFTYSTIANLLIRDNLYFEKKIGNWTIEPAVNISFRYFSDSLAFHSISMTNSNDPNFPGGANSQGSTNYYHYKTYFLTPSLNIYYKNLFNIQGGFLYNLSSNNALAISADPPRFFPFVNATADIMHLLNNNATTSIKLHGAYAVSYPLGDNYVRLSDFSSTIVSPVTITQVYNPGDPTSSGGFFQTGGNELYRTFKTLTAGIEIAPAKSRFTISYLFEKRDYVTTIELSTPTTGGYQPVNTNTTTYLNTINVNYKLFNTATFKWQAGINATSIKQKIDYFGLITGAGTWTGGFTNRLEHKNIFWGADVLYLFGQNLYNIASPQKINSLVLQNLYAGAKIKVAHLKDAEVFINSRNIAQNKTSDITDNRRFYGFGFKLGL
ncbi:MAG TPA: hypothetical protein VK668_05535 [Mucilaginibacter sp.]|nr:hypothetical protein [Mucilaginibacter sp.]